MPDRVSNFTLLVPGSWVDTRPLFDALTRSGVQARGYDPERAIENREVVVELVEDDEVASGFTYGRNGKLPAPLLKRIAQTRQAAVVDIGLHPLRDHEVIARIGRALKDAGGLAVRMELSGGASPWEPWIAAFESGSTVDIYEAAVIFVRDGVTTFTCGMHHFDRPDATIERLAPGDAIAWLDALHLFELFEAPMLASGHTFCPQAGQPRRVIERWPDARHRGRDARYNPFGVWRLSEPSVPGRPQPKLYPTIIPPLIVMLTAKENACRRPLTRAEVESITEASPAVAMQLQAVIDLERARGYADIDPAQAWAQWQLVVASR